MKCNVSFMNKANVSKQIFLLHNFPSITGHMMNLIKGMELGFVGFCHLTQNKLEFSFFVP